MGVEGGRGGGVVLGCVVGEGTRKDATVLLVDTGGNDCKWSKRNISIFGGSEEGKRRTGHSEGYNSH